MPMTDSRLYDPGEPPAATACYSLLAEPTPVSAHSVTPDLALVEASCRKERLD